MKRIILVLLFMCLFFSGCGKKKAVSDDLSRIEQRGKIVVGVRGDASPFGFRDKNGVLSGYDIDLAKILAENIIGNSSAVEFVPVTAANRIMKLNSGEVDCLIATMSITNQRQQILDFSIPYYMAGQAIMVRSSSKASSLRDFEGNRLIIVYGSTSERNLRSNVPEVTVLGYKTYHDAYNALKSGKAEGIVADDTVLLNYALHDKSVKLLPKRYSKEPYAIAFRKGQQSARLISKTNYVLDNLQRTGKLNRLQEKWKIK